MKDDFMVGKFLSFLDKQMNERPDLIEPIDEAQLNRISELLNRVEASMNKVTEYEVQ